MEIIIENKKANQIKVSEKTINETLCLYPFENRIISNVKVENNKAIANLINQDITYSFAKPDYFTAEQIILAVSQLGYALSGMLIKNNKINDVPPQYYTTFISKIKNLDCYFHSFNFEFKNKIMKTEDNILTMEAEKIIFRNNKLYGIFVVKVKNSFIGQIKFITN